jgi:acetyltransferase-like isoleucine patch superfamily enzyme
VSPVDSDRLRKVPWFLRYRAGPRLTSDLRKLIVLATHRHCHVEFKGPVRLGRGFELFIPDHGTLIVGSGVDFRRGFVCQISGSGQVTIGDGTVFTSNALVQCTTSIDIGRRCIFSQSTQLVDGTHRFREASLSVLDQGYDYRPLKIGDDVWVAAKCTIFADIGERAVIGAQSVVSRPVPPRCLAVGAPAKPVEFFDPAPVNPVTTGNGDIAAECG